MKVFLTILAFLGTLGSTQAITVDRAEALFDEVNRTLRTHIAFMMIHDSPVQPTAYTTEGRVKMQKHFIHAMSEEMFIFVAAHEIGHNILGHTTTYYRADYYDPRDSQSEFAADAVAIHALALWGFDQRQAEDAVIDLMDYLYDGDDPHAGEYGSHGSYNSRVKHAKAVIYSNGLYS